MNTGQYDYQMLQQLQSINTVLNNIYSFLQSMASDIRDGFDFISVSIQELLPYFYIIIICFLVKLAFDVFFPKTGMR